MESQKRVVIFFTFFAVLHFHPTIGKLHYAAL